tara:strand:+ start:235 stop:573 length:339 start_codon:yes stop_codon:yes gene_type:complete
MLDIPIHHRQIYNAYWNHLGQCLKKEFEEAQAKGDKKQMTYISNKIKSMLEMVQFTNRLLLDYQFVCKNYRQHCAEYENEINQLKEEYKNELNTFRLENLDESRFARKNGKR